MQSSSKQTLPLIAGAFVKARHMATKLGPAGTSWFEGYVRKLHADGHVDVEFLDGDTEDRVAPRYVKVLEPAAIPSSVSAEHSAATAEPSASEAAAAEGSVLGKRKVKATVVQIGNQFVKRQNMYDMEQGEGSVWDRELSGHTDAAFEYKERAAPALLPKVKKQAAPRVQSAEEKERLERNDTMRSAKEATAATRARFLEPHRATLERFGARLPAAGRATGGGATGGFVEDDSIEQPAQIQVPMRDYQLRGLRWLVGMHKCGVNAILADEMGLGKTLQSISLLGCLSVMRMDGQEQPPPHLVVLPLTVLGNWERELARWCPKLKVVKLYGNQEVRKEQLAEIKRGQFHVCVTTYETIAQVEAGDMLSGCDMLSG